jgi:hypothetical protein
MVCCLAAGAACSRGKVYAGPKAPGDFDKRVAQYVKLHKAARAEIHGLKQTDSPEEIAEQQAKLADLIRQARRGARIGDIFTPPVAAAFRQLIDNTMRSTQAPRILESLRSSSPVTRPIQVNEPYPSGVPLQSTPPSLLMNLPQLPPELDYRVVGGTLILRDVDANLVVDCIPDVIPRVGG